MLLQIYYCGVLPLNNSLTISWMYCGNGKNFLTQLHTIVSIGHTPGFGYKVHGFVLVKLTI